MAFGIHVITGPRRACSNGRVLRPEILTDASEQDRARNLRDLAAISKWLGGQRILGRLLSGLVDTDTPFSLLDVGSASSGLGDSVRRCFPRSSVVSADWRHAHVVNATGTRVAADAFHLPFHNRSFDFVFCSLLMHEYADSDIKRLLRSLHNISNTALIVMDLQRHPAAYHFLSLSRWLFRWGEVTLHDGPVSVEAGFTLPEMDSLARGAGLGDFTVRRHLPWFRLSLVARR